MVLPSLDWMVDDATRLAECRHDHPFAVLGVQPLPEGGWGVPSLQRTLSFATLGPASRAAGQLPTLVLPGLTVRPGGGERGVEPSIIIAGTGNRCVSA